MNRLHIRGIQKRIGEPFSIQSIDERAALLKYAAEQTFPDMEPENLSLEDLTAAGELQKEWDRQNMIKEIAE